MRIERFEGGPFAENCYVVSCPESGGCVIVDPGAAAPRALEHISSEGLEPKAVLLTHAHLDHVDGLPAVRDAHPGLPIHLHPKDGPLWDAVSQQAQMFGMPRVDLPARWDVDLVEGETLDFGGSLRFDVRFTPGHAPGHVIFVATDAGVVLVGDVVFQGSIGRTDLPGGDMATLMRSIREQVLTLPPATLLHPGHGPGTTVQREKSSNPFLIGGPSRFA